MYTTHPDLQNVFNLMESGNNEHNQRLFRGLMQDENLEKLGSGAFGTVYEHYEKNKVIKQSTQRDAYYMFARWCMEPEQRDNPHLPNIFEERLYVDEDGTQIFIHVLERLETPSVARVMHQAKHKGRRCSNPDTPADCPDAAIGMMWKAARSLSRKHGWARNEFNTTFPTKPIFIKHLLKECHASHNAEPKEYPVMITYAHLRRYRGWVSTVFTLFDKFSPIANLDFHGGNIMIRPGENYLKRATGTLVITDPVSEIYSSYHDERSRVSTVDFSHQQYHDTAQFVNPALGVFNMMPAINIGEVNVDYKTAHIGSPRTNNFNKYYQTPA